MAYSIVTEGWGGEEGGEGGEREGRGKKKGRWVVNYQEGDI